MSNEGEQIPPDCILLNLFQGGTTKGSKYSTHIVLQRKHQDGIRYLHTFTIGATCCQRNSHLERGSIVAPLRLGPKSGRQERGRIQGTNNGSDSLRTNCHEDTIAVREYSCDNNQNNTLAASIVLWCRGITHESASTRWRLRRILSGRFLQLVSTITCPQASCLLCCSSLVVGRAFVCPSVRLCLASETTTATKTPPTLGRLHTEKES